MKTTAKIAVLCSGMVLAGWNMSLQATGFRLPDQDAFATARGEAFVATADNPSAVYYNPAGISQLEGDQARVGVYGLFMNPSYERLTGGGTYHSSAKYHAVPQVFYTHSFESAPLTFGLGLYSPYGLSSDWQQDTGFRTLATKGTLTYYTINPVLSWRIITNFSLAFGLSANYVDTDLQQGLVWPSQAYDNFKFKGDGWAVGYNLGALWKVHEKVSIGATFRGSTETTLEGSTEYYNDVPFSYGSFYVPSFPRQTVDAKADMKFPLQAALGVSYRPTPKWNLEFDAEYTDWNQVTVINIQQQRGFGTLLSKNVALNLNWRSSWYYEFGATHYFDNGWHVSAGYIYNENSMPDANYTPLVADLDRHFLSAGVGYKGSRWSFDVAYQFGYGPERTVTGSGYSAIGQTADGRYEFISHAVSLSVGLSF